MAPIKALCSERYNDWKEKLEPLGLKCMELTGDTEVDDFYRLQEVQVILTTPEKWDSMTRKWRDNAGVMQAICLFLIDEVCEMVFNILIQLVGANVDTVYLNYLLLDDL